MACKNNSFFKMSFFQLEALDKEYRDNFGSLQTEADKAADLLAIANAAQNVSHVII